MCSSLNKNIVESIIPSQIQRILFSWRRWRLRAGFEDTFNRKQLWPASPGTKSKHVTVTANCYAFLLPVFPLTAYDKLGKGLGRWETLHGSLRYVLHGNTCFLLRHSPYAHSCLHDPSTSWFNRRRDAFQRCAFTPTAIKEGNYLTCPPASDGWIWISRAAFQLNKAFRGDVASKQGSATSWRSLRAGLWLVLISRPCLWLQRIKISNKINNTSLWFHCMPCARSFSPKSYICIQRHISCKWYNFSFFSKQRNTHFFYMFI